MESVGRYFHRVGSALSVLMNVILGGRRESLCARFHRTDHLIGRLINSILPNHTDTSNAFWSRLRDD